MRKIHRLGLVGLFVFSLAWPVLAQGPAAGGTSAFSGGQVKGAVRDARTNRPVPGATVEVLATDTGAMVARTFVGSDGRFELRANLKRAVIVASAAGYHPARITVDLVFGGGRTVMLSLRPKKSSRSPDMPPSGNPMIGVGSLNVPPEAREEYQKAMEMLGKKNKQSEATKHLQKAIELYPEYVEAHHLLGTVHLDRGELQEAESYLTRAIELNDRYGPAYVALGVIRNREKNYAEAEKMLKKGLEYDPTSWQGNLELAKSHYFQGHLQDAEARGLRAHELNDKNLEIHMVMADVSIRLGNLERSKEEYEHFLAQEPNHPMAGPIKQQMKKIDEILKEQAGKQ